MSDEKKFSEDIALKPAPNADSEEEVKHHINPKIISLYDVYSYRHAAAILKSAYPKELGEIEGALLGFKITTKDISMPGGNESIVPKKLASVLRSANWLETRIQGDLIVRILKQREQLLGKGRIKKVALPEKEPVVIKNYIDGHKIDFVKGQVALDLEWNSKDQTYDRDLYAFRVFYECGIISVAALITRSEKLNEIFKALPLRTKDGEIDKRGDRERLCIEKFGASTTWMGKLLYRLNAGRHGGCPVLVFGIKPDVVSDWPIEKERFKS